MYGYIYKTTNLINGKIYIGQKKGPVFLGNDYLGSGIRLRDAIKCYGKNSFNVELIEEIDIEERMDEQEIFWIKFYNSTNKNIGYNLSEGGNVNRTLRGENNGNFGNHYSDECRALISQKMKLSMTSERKEYLRKINLGENNKRFGTTHSEETKQLMSEKAHLRYSNIEERIKQSKRMQKIFDEHPDIRKKISDSKNKFYSNPEERVKQSERMKNRVYKKEWADKNSIVQKELWNNEERRKRHSQQKLEFFETHPEVKKKLSEAILGRKFVTNGTITKQVKPNEVEYYLSIGYWLGMKKRNVCDKID